MKNMKKKGFTIVELVIVIAVVAVLAAVLIPTFASLIKKANDSAYLQERTNQQIADLAEKVTNQNYLTWEDFESKLAEKLADINKDALTEADISTAIEQALKEFVAANQGQNTGLTEEQVKKIVEKAMEGQLTTAQVEAIVKAAIDGIEIPAMPEGLTEDQVKTIVDEAIKKLQGSIGNTGITKAQMEAAINEAIRAALEGVTGAPDEATL
jgi:type IV pilus assembly protein PilA